MSLALRVIRSNWSTLLALRPAPSMAMSPPLTSKLRSWPFSITGAPVLRVARGVLMKPQPSQVMPWGLATMTFAACPATSV
ncbi:hypothetical protein M2262_002829 [Pseudomonas sp. BIGb0408]|uniref:Uncharacterized protein n=1 Tax=Phytopseudomonas flavescens TaxID=29435 RepID=A0A7Z0BQ09_9GAMM|nr:hypothetical protein [Pseudomonas sp. BIGb0408]NYH72651.1 hypothetical protein [Pseudomonas flavescens]